MGKKAEIVGYTICNDVSAWDLERENPLYLPQSKIYQGSCALGPFLVTPEEVPDPYNLTIRCRITRKGMKIFEDSVNTSHMKRRLEELRDSLCRYNPVPSGTVVSTGTGIMVPNELPLQEGDIVEIEVDRLGTLSNSVKQL